MLKGEGSKTVIPHALSRALPLCIVKMNSTTGLDPINKSGSYCMLSNGIVCYCIVLYGIVLYAIPVLLYDIVRHCPILHKGSTKMTPLFGIAWHSMIFRFKF